VLPRSEPIVIRGCTEPRDVTDSRKALVEFLTSQRLATTADARTVRLVIYAVEPDHEVWEAKRYAASTLYSKIPVKLENARLLFRTAAEAWTVSDIWREFDELNSTFAGFLEAIQEIPLYVLFSRTADPDERPPFLTQTDVEDAEHARIEYEARRQPALRDLCRELGLEAVLNEDDEGLRAAQFLDRARRRGPAAEPLPRTDADFMRRLKKCLGCYYYRQELFDRAAEENALGDLVNHWISLGFIFLGKSRLADLINRKHGTHHTPASIAAACRRLGLKAKRPRGSFKELSDELLNAAIEVPPEFDYTQFFMS